ncbi:tRNA pseudouridine(55) synthase TruB [Leucobacter sp. gxy201]|uniref:tRNA pseudouridine(55) synthase TruB n=1 Tax=Leucobacter sp. gxy201 TaxID=2957200 RepID=UPI003DA14A59
MIHEAARTPEQGAILFVDKAEGWTSHDVVAKARRTLGTRKVGHAGTLDPMATGLLVLGVGPATRLLTHLVGLGKTYETTIRLGASTVTDDREGSILDIAAPVEVEELAAHPERIGAGVADLTGAIEQAPSAVSAIKVDGKRAYDRVRDGEQVELKKRPVTIHSFEIEEPRLVAAASLSGSETPFDVIDVDAIVECSSGTYIRALARDLGEGLGVGGHLVALRRTRVGPFGLSGATPVADLAEGRVGRLFSPTEIARMLFPELPLTDEQAVDLGNGKRLEVGEHRDAPLVAAIAPDGRLVGLVEVRKGRTRVVTNFPVPVGGPEAAR